MKQLRRYLPTFLFLAGFLFWGSLSQTPTALLTLLAIVIHEIGHIVGAKLIHAPLRGFSLISHEVRLLTDHRILPYGKEIFICAFGPLFNLFSAAIALVGEASLFGSNPLSVFANASLSLALLNLLPIDSFDGGKMLSCLLSLFSEPRISFFICRAASFLSLFSLWCVSVYALMRAAESLSLFLFSSTLFVRLFFPNSRE